MRKLILPPSRFPRITSTPISKQHVKKWTKRFRKKFQQMLENNVRTQKFSCCQNYFRKICEICEFQKQSSETFSNDGLKNRISAELQHSAKISLLKTSWEKIWRVICFEIQFQATYPKGDKTEFRWFVRQFYKIVIVGMTPARTSTGYK